ncbi:hypothetical protein RUM44_012512 [Polyplax serrata]|uniref:Elongator complex protein 5 n=1 Tax=Polyplax serrata TaxID=468196 RepID=A0ABR1BBJ6_POLSC
MLKSISEGNHSSKLTILQDSEDGNLKDLFKAFLTELSRIERPSEIHLICHEFPPDFYLSSHNRPSGINVYDFFSDPCGWNDKTAPVLSSVFAKLTELSEQVLFFDSLYHLTLQLGFHNAYRLLNGLKSKHKSIFVMVHEDLFNSHELEKFLYLPITFIKIRSNADNVALEKTKKVVDVKYRKANCKISIQTELFFVTDEFRLSSEVCKSKSTPSKVINSNTDFDTFTMFELGLKMKDSERKAKEELVLPYLRKEVKQQSGDIIYNLEAIDLEEDPDDDLDI